ncbi:uncharacterized protein LOC129761658 [Toxorhynchites rutilus septentrionalis]|uniref:uncharacterized protein LOC129761658 n=1 Tax=Toxorhynchites rutilus septentrionalis TaxID=329112 RepID=UPI0024788B1F|nr:uncharacterized protein LOC129761658 [Toxorhynchites rutilus septentrionalis]
MKVSIVGSLLLLLVTVASASYWHYVPPDTPEVQHAKAEHLAAHAHARGAVGEGPMDTLEVQYAKAEHLAAHAAAKAGHPLPVPVRLPTWHELAAGAVGHDSWHGKSAWHGAYHVPVIHNGVPVDTPEVQHAKAAHLHALAAAGHGHGYDAGHEDDGSYKPHLYEHAPTFWVPWDRTEESMAVHLSTENLFEGNCSGLDSDCFFLILQDDVSMVLIVLRYSTFHSPARQISVTHRSVTDVQVMTVLHAVLPSLTARVDYVTEYMTSYDQMTLTMKAFIVGSVLLLASAASAAYWHHVPADTHDVAAAKAEHFAAHQSARAAVGAGPFETPEVQHAKAEHFAAHAAARAGHSGSDSGWHADESVVAARDWHGEGAWHGPQHIPVIHKGVPVETPEVQHAKAAHLAALASASDSGAHHWGSHHEQETEEDDGSYKSKWEHHNY